MAINEGIHKGVIRSVEITEPAFPEEGENAFDIVFGVEVEKENISVRVEFSKRPPAYDKTTTQAEVAIRTLKGLGYTRETDLSSLDELVGKEASVKAKLGKERKDKDGSTIAPTMNYYFTTGRKEIENKDEISRRVLAVIGEINDSRPADSVIHTPASKPVSAKAPSSATVSPTNPFAGMK